MRWDPQKVKPNRLFLLIGKRGSGKTTCLENIMWELQQAHTIDLGIGICPTIPSRRMLSEHLPMVHAEYSENIVNNLMDTAQDMLEKDKNKHFLLVLDDCMFDRKTMASTTMRKLAMNGRNYNIAMMNCLQYVMDIPVAIRSQIDYVIALRENVKANRQRLYKQFFGVFDSFNSFEKVFSRCTENYGAIVLDNTNPTLKLEESIYFYRAKPSVPGFRISNPIYWRLIDEHKQKKQKKSGTMII